jgi:hypothetical protein
VGWRERRGRRNKGDLRGEGEGEEKRLGGRKGEGERRTGAQKGEGEREGEEERSTRGWKEEVREGRRRARGGGRVQERDLNRRRAKRREMNITYGTSIIFQEEGPPIGSRGIVHVVSRVREAGGIHEVHVGRGGGDPQLRLFFFVLGVEQEEGRGDVGGDEVEALREVAHDGS